MSRALLALACLFASTATAGDLAGGQAIQSPRIEPVGGSGAQLSYAALVGPDRGVTVATAQAQVQLADLHVIAQVPVASYATGLGQDVDVGNVSLSGWYDLPYLGIDHSMGLRVHFGAGEPAYAWQNRPEELWPGAGADLLWQGRFGTNGTTLLLQGSLGLHTSADYAPFPDTWFRMGASAGIDRDLGRRLGLTATLDLQTWDTTPIEMSLAGRVDLVEGLRLRAGTLLPLATWMGATPADRPAGVREVTLFASLGLVL